MNQQTEIDHDRYYTERPTTWGEYPDWVDWADPHSIVGYGDIGEEGGDVEWITHVTPGYFRKFAELVEYAYGGLNHSDNPTGSVELGIGLEDDETTPCVLFARESNSDSEKVVACATRITQKGEE